MINFMRTALLVSLLPVVACVSGAGGSGGKAGRPTSAETVAATTDVMDGSREGTAAGPPARMPITEDGTGEQAGLGAGTSPPGAEYARPCPTSLAQLDSWITAKVPGVYWLDVQHERHGWVPAERIPMPPHHATRLELTNVDEMPLLGGPTGAKARIVVELTDRDVEHDEKRGIWFDLYHARVVEVCAPA